MTVRSRLTLGVVLLLAMACGRKSEVPPAEGMTATPTIHAAPGDVGPESGALADTSPRAGTAPAHVPGATTPAASAPRGSAVIGYDSAFGPRYELDSAGRPMPITKRKP